MKCNLGKRDVKCLGSKVDMASRLKTRLTFDDMLSDIFDDDFRLSDCESSEEEEDVYACSSKSNLAHGEMAVLSKAVSK